MSNMDGEYTISDNLNLVKDYGGMQGGLHPMLRNNINIKRVLLENGSRYDVLVSIHGSMDGDPKSKFILYRGESINLGVNPSGNDPQYIWVFDINSKKLINTPHIINRHINNFVITNGLNIWWIDDYRQPSLS